MADKSAIEWTDATWSPVTGCDPISAGCKHCYAKREVEIRWSKNPKSEWFGRPFNDVRCHPEKLAGARSPLAWKRPRRIFVCPRADLFHEAVPFEFIAAVFAVMATANRHTYQVLTKRPYRMGEFFRWLEKRSAGANARYMSSYDYQAGVRARQKLRDEGKPSLDEPSPPTEIVRALYDIGAPAVNAVMDPSARFHHLRSLGQCHWMKWPLKHVWLGVSVEDQATADKRIPLLLQTPAAVRWVSAEPLLGPVDLGFGDQLGDDDDSSVGCYPCDSGGRRHEHYISETCGRGIDWVVVGGESGPKARPMQGDWARGLRDQCAAAGVPFLFKQWGEWIDADQADNEAKDALWRNRSHFEMRDAGLIANIPPKPPGPPHYACNYTIRIGKKAAGRLLDGVLHDEYPEVLP